MQHKLNLHKAPFDLIKSGIKTIESRLFDEKRQKINIGDELIFISRENGDIIKTEVFKLYKAENFLELSKIINLEKTGTNTTKLFLESLEIYYSKEKQENFGVIGIEFKIK